MAAEKPFHTLILDAGPIIRNHPTVSSLLAQSEQLLTVPAIISEIRDAATRSRVETTLIPFLTLRRPSDNSVKFVTDFARRTGDAAVLSAVDLQVAALAYEVECERNGGAWRLRREPGQRRVNGAPPVKDCAAEDGGVANVQVDGVDAKDSSVDSANSYAAATESEVGEAEHVDATANLVPSDEAKGSLSDVRSGDESTQNSEQISDTLDGLPLDQSKSEEVKGVTDSATTTLASPEQPTQTQGEAQAEDVDVNDDDDSSTDGGEWITPTNLKRHQEADSNNASTTPRDPSKPAPVLQVATLTTDHALQNLLLQINLNLLSANLTRISSIRTTLLRCHACFKVHKQPDVKFCQRCGQPALTRVTCTTDASTGELKVHLKKNMQWSHRGDRYSIPRPVAGASNGKIKGGGKNGWGNGLVLVEDQKEWSRAEEERKREERRREKVGAMDEDYLPGLLTGRRTGREGGRKAVGAGRNVNSRKR